MSKQTKPLNILLYEDKADYAASFKIFAQKVRILTEQVDNVDDLLEKVKENSKKYNFLVLDAKAYRREGQAEGTEDEINLITILQELDKLKYQKGIHIPHCINTGFADLKLRLSHTVDCPIFEKGNENELFKYIWETYNSSDNAKLLLNYPEIFEFAEIHFEAADFSVLFNLFNSGKFNSGQIEDRINNLNALRRTAEHLLDILHKKYLNSLAGIVTSNGSRLREIADYFNNRSEIPVHVYSLLTTIRRTASGFGSHTPESVTNPDDYPSGNFIGGLAVSLKDVFYWANTKLT